MATEGLQFTRVGEQGEEEAKILHTVKDRRGGRRQESALQGERTAFTIKGCKYRCLANFSFWGDHLDDILWKSRWH